jgi:hypothetical protein
MAFMPLLNSARVKSLRGFNTLVYHENVGKVYTKDNVLNLQQAVLTEFLRGANIGESVYGARANFNKYSVDDNDVRPEALTYRLMGDPTLTIEDLYKDSKVDVQPESKNSDRIEIPIGKSEIEFLIKNIGKVDVNYSFDKNSVLEISPIAGLILINNEVKVKLKILGGLPINYQSSDKSQSSPKQRTTKIYFKSDAGDREITVVYWSA